MVEVERLLAAPDSGYADLRGKFRILPITTTIYGEDSLENRIPKDFQNIDKFISQGGLVLGWQNQNTVASNRYAIGGGVSKLSFQMDGAIQGAMRGYAANRGPQEAVVAKGIAPTTSAVT